MLYTFYHIFIPSYHHFVRILAATIFAICSAIRLSPATGDGVLSFFGTDGSPEVGVPGLLPASVEYVQVIEHIHLLEPVHFLVSMVATPLASKL